MNLFSTLRKKAHIDTIHSYLQFCFGSSTYFLWKKYKTIIPALLANFKKKILPLPLICQWKCLRQAHKKGVQCITDISVPINSVEMSIVTTKQSCWELPRCYNVAQEFLYFLQFLCSRITFPFSVNSKKSDLATRNFWAFVFWKILLLTFFLVTSWSISFKWLPCISRTLTLLWFHKANLAAQNLFSMPLYE